MIGGNVKNYALNFSIFRVIFEGMLKDTSNCVDVIKKVVSVIIFFIKKNGKCILILYWILTTILHMNMIVSISQRVLN